MTKGLRQNHRVGIFVSEAALDVLGLAVRSDWPDAQQRAALRVAGLIGDESQPFEVGGRVFGRLGIGERSQLHKERSRSVVFLSTLGRDRTGISLLDGRERLVRLRELAQSLLAQAGTVE